ncbi:ankyrin repeat domain-containing protein SOWAHB-like [Antennarius striatus]|uniref:ankyrin repeat domain-containing protein SOWAHB-like n=1 Tax=Antennarius striatus TaxID=241820 RepID=UPI0035B1B9E6
MATDFTQDAVLHFLQVRGGSVKNSELLLYFRGFIRDHSDRDRNRELFKKYVNSVATVQQVDGVSHVVLRKKFRGHVPGGGERVSPRVPGGGERVSPRVPGGGERVSPRVPGGGERVSPRVPDGKKPDPSAESARRSPAGRAGGARQKPPATEVSTPSGATVLPAAGATVLPAAGATVLPAAGATVLPAAGATVLPAAGATVLPAAGATVLPAAGATVLPAAGATVLPAAGIILNNNTNNVKRNHNLKQNRTVHAPEVTGGPAAALVGVPTPSPPAKKQHAEVGRPTRSHSPPPGVTPVVPAIRRPGETVQPPDPEPLNGRLAGSLYQEPPLHSASLYPEVVLRRKYRQSYKAAVSYDDDDGDEEEETQMRRGSTGGVLSMNAPLGVSMKTMSASSPCIIDQGTPPPVLPSSSSLETPPPKIYVQDVRGEMLPSDGPDWRFELGLGPRERWAGLGVEPGPDPEEFVSARQSHPSEAERNMMSAVQEKEVVHRLDVHTDPRRSQPAGVQMDTGQSFSMRLSRSSSSLTSPSSEVDRSSSYEDLHRMCMPQRDPKIKEALQRAQRTRMHHDDTVPWQRSADHLHVDQEPPAHVSSWQLSTGDLRDDREEAESSEGSSFSTPLRQRPTVARRVSSQLRNRMCRSLGADLDQLLQEDARGGRATGSEAARLNRLQLISSTLSLPYNLSSSSLSSCSTPPRCHSFTDLLEGAVGKGGRRSLPATSSSSLHHEGSSRQLLVPLEPREHAWLVKSAAGAWPDIYSLFREDSSLLNKRDFISGFTVLHWIAKHGDHRVLNTLWYGVEKAGLTFDIDAKSASGHTPLHIAAMHGHKNIMRLLVGKFKANVRLRDTAGKRPWQYLSRSAASDIFLLLGAPPRAAGKGEGGGGRADNSWKPEQPHRRRRRHHFSTASSGQRPVTIAGTIKVKRSSSIAAFLKHKSLRRFHGHHSDASV